MAHTTAVATFARASWRPMIRAPRRAPYTRLCAHTRTPAGVCFISAVAATPIWLGSTSLTPRYSSTSCGASSNGRNLFGSTSGALAISFCGTIAAPCTGATPLTRTAGGLCTAPRPRARGGQSDAQGQRVQYSPAHHLPDVSDPLRGPGQHLDGGAADQGRT